MSELKIGTIVRNHWASEDNPTKHFIYTGISGELATVISYDGKKLINNKYYKNDLKDTEKYEPVGYCEAFDIMKKDLINWNKRAEVKESKT
jgi:hypothetical protein